MGCMCIAVIFREQVNDIARKTKSYKEHTKRKRIHLNCIGIVLVGKGRLCVIVRRCPCTSTCYPPPPPNWHHVHRTETKEFTPPSFFLRVKKNPFILSNYLYMNDELTSSQIVAYPIDGNRIVNIHVLYYRHTYKYISIYMCVSCFNKSFIMFIPLLRLHCCSRDTS